MKLKILPYKSGSESARLLSQHLSQLLGYKVFRIRPEFNPRPHHLVINWGSRTPKPRSWNHVEAARIARNKLLTFMKFREHNVPTVEWTHDNKALAGNWITEGKAVYFRHSLEGQGGAGMQVAHTPDEFNTFRNAPLYTKYFSARSEYRVHIAFGEVIDFAKKKKRNGAEGNKYIRNHDNGYVYARNDVNLPEVVAAASKQAVAALSLDFGAVDVLHNETDNRAAVLEINTAPGLDNHTAERYARAFASRVARV